MDANELALICPDQWDALSAAALDPNPFYSRRYLTAALSTIDRDTRLRALTIHSADGRLVGLFPYRLGRFPVPVAIGANNIYQMSGQPLIHRDFAAEVITAWFEAMESGVIPRRWRFPHVSLSSGFARLCIDTLPDGFEMVPFGRYMRPRMERVEGGFEMHLQTVLSRSRLKDVQRSLRRLQKAGELTLEHATQPTLVSRRVEDFLHIEHSGWKGQSGTSLLSDPVHASFLRQAVAANENASTDTLLLDGRPIAVNVNLTAAGTLFTPKCAYDEAFRRFSPGIVLEYLVMQDFYQRDGVVQMDAATTTDGHLLEGLWNDAQPMGEVLVGPFGLQTRILAHAGAAKPRLKALAKAAGSDRLVTAFRKLRRINPELWQRLTSLGQGATCLILYI